MIDDLKKQTNKQQKSSAEPLRPSVPREAILLKPVSPAKSGDKMIDRTLSSRHEIKYLVSESKARSLMRFVESYLALDEHCKTSPNGLYPIVSTYLDSHDLKLCRESIDGKKNRFKLRVRGYNDDPDYPRFFEIKRRMNTIILKGRARVKQHNVAKLLTGKILPPHDYSTDQNVLRQFRLYMNSINAAPVIKIRYLRRAYEGDSNNRVRVTFDYQLAFNASNKPDVMFTGYGWQRYPIEGVVLEIKFTGHYPIWLNRMVKCFDLRNQSLSKYARSISKACSLGFCSPTVPVRIYSL